MVPVEPDPALRTRPSGRSLITSETCTVVHPLPLPQNTLFKLEALCQNAPFQRSVSSDGSHFPLRRGGSYSNLKPETEQITELLLKAPEILELFQQYFGERLKVHGAQINRTDKGQSLRAHTHGPEDRFAVLHLGLPYTGGRYFEIDSAGFKHYPRIPPYSLVLNTGSISHGVDEVTSATPRIVIVMFLKPDNKPPVQS